MRILLFGQNGQLGWELTERLSYIGELYHQLAHLPTEQEI